MKKVLFVIAFFCFKTIHSQSVKFVNFVSGSNLTSISFITDQDIIIKISQEGNILVWGYEQEPGRYYQIPGMLKPYMGRVEYYSNETDSILNGKVKSIGTANITYYGSSEKKEFAGKIKMLGRSLFSYFGEFDNEMLRGKIKSAGNKNFDYYNSFEDEAIKGKIKQVGNTAIKYFSSFDDKALRGKVKSAGSVTIQWNNSLDRYPGTLKNGNQAVYVEGVAYILW